MLYKKNRNNTTELVHGHTPQAKTNVILKSKDTAIRISKK